jgi:hypothetical protein
MQPLKKRHIRYSAMQERSVALGGPSDPGGVKGGLPCPLLRLEMAIPFGDKVPALISATSLPASLVR